jgi:transcriptional regulator GlxA family with amidase domain
VETLRSHYPQVRLRPERILVRSGHDGRIVTSGGTGSWEDLALFLVGSLCGEAEAIRTSKIFVFGDRSEGQLPYAVMRRPDRHDDAAIAASQEWIASNYAVAHPVARMAEHSGMNERTFARRFKIATGYAPVDYVQTLRVEEAKQMLETTDEPTDVVARAVGYEDPAYFRLLFKRKCGVSPARYRRRFRLRTL